MADDIRNLWDRQKGEPAKRFAAFVLYRDGRPGFSLADLHAAHFSDSSTTLRTIERWSSAHNWIARRGAYADHLDRLRQTARLAKLGELEEKLIDRAGDIMTAAINAAVEGDVRAQKDLLDRIGLVRKKAESDATPGLNLSVEGIQALLEHSSLSELVAVLASLEHTK